MGRYLNLLHEFRYFTLIVVQFISDIAQKNPKTYYNEKSRFKFFSWQKKLARNVRSGPPEVIVEKDVLKICSKFAGEYPCQSVIPEKWFATLLESDFDMGVPRKTVFITSFLKNTPGELLWKCSANHLFSKILKTTGSGLSFLMKI